MPLFRGLLVAAHVHYTSLVASGHISHCVYVYFTHCVCVCVCRFFVMGATLVLLATFLYSTPQPSTDEAKPVIVEQPSHVVKVS